MTTPLLRDQRMLFPLVMLWLTEFPFMGVWKFVCSAQWPLFVVAVLVLVTAVVAGACWGALRGVGSVYRGVVVCSVVWCDVWCFLESPCVVCVFELQVRRCACACVCVSVSGL